MSDVYHKPQEPIMWGGSSLYHKPHAPEFFDSTYRKEHLYMGSLIDPKKLAKPASLEKPKGEAAPTNTREMYSGRGNVRFA